MPTNQIRGLLFSRRCVKGRPLCSFIVGPTLKFYKRDLRKCSCSCCVETIYMRVLLLHVCVLFTQRLLQYMLFGNWFDKKENPKHFECQGLVSGFYSSLFFFSIL